MLATDTIDMKADAFFLFHFASRWISFPFWKKPDATENQ